MTISDSENSPSVFGIIADTNFPALNRFLTALQDPDHFLSQRKNTSSIPAPDTKWTLKTKYYSTEIENHIVPLENNFFSKDAILASSKALCVLLSAPDQISGSLLDYIKGSAADTKLVIFPTTPIDDPMDIVHPTVAEIVCLDKATDHENPLERTGFARVREVLETTDWGDVIPKDNETSSPFVLDSLFSSIRSIVETDKKAKRDYKEECDKLDKVDEESNSDDNDEEHDEDDDNEEDEEDEEDVQEDDDIVSFSENEEDEEFIIEQLRKVGEHMETLSENDRRKFADEALEGLLKLLE